MLYVLRSAYWEVEVREMYDRVKGDRVRFFFLDAVNTGSGEGPARHLEDELETASNSVPPHRIIVLGVHETRDGNHPTVINEGQSWKGFGRMPQLSGRGGLIA